MEHRCESCRRSYETKSPKSRFCSSTCRSRAHRSGPIGVVSGLPAAADRSGELVAWVEKHLEDANRLDTFAGQAAVDIARRIDETPAAPLSQVAAAHRELRAAVAEAIKGANATKSALQKRRDELAERRQKRA